jgi:hypothetical protein
VCLTNPRRNSFFFFPPFGVLIFLPSHNPDKQAFRQFAALQNGRAT